MMQYANVAISAILAFVCNSLQWLSISFLQKTINNFILFPLPRF